MHRASASELQERIAAEREGHAFLILRDAAGSQRLLRLDQKAGPVTVGRGEACRIRVEWDLEMSRVHAELLYVGDDWTLADDGLSRNGSFVNGERVVGRRRLRDGDELSLGATTMVFRRPQRSAAGQTTLTSIDRFPISPVSDAQRRVLIALCRPFADDREFASPARNQEIADELYLSVAAVKTHLRALFGRFSIEELPQNEKRLRLVELAFQTGIVTDHDLRQAGRP